MKTDIFQFVVIHTVKSFSEVNKVEEDFFFSWNSLPFSVTQMMLAFDFWILCLFLIQLVHFQVLGLHTVEG